MVSKGDFALIHENQDSTFQYDQIKRSPGSFHDDKRWLQLKLVLFRHCYWHHKHHHVPCKLQCALKVVMWITRSIFFFSSIRCMLARNERKFQHVKKDNAKLEYYQIRYKSFGEKRHYTMIYYILVFVVSFWLLLRLDIYFFDFVLFTCLLMESLGSQSIYESCFFVVVFFFFLAIWTW